MSIWLEVGSTTRRRRECSSRRANREVEAVVEAETIFFVMWDLYSLAHAWIATCVHIEVQYDHFTCFNLRRAAVMLHRAVSETAASNVAEPRPMGMHGHCYSMSRALVCVAEAFEVPSQSKVPRARRLRRLQFRKLVGTNSAQLLCGLSGFGLLLTLALTF